MARHRFFLITLNVFIFFLRRNPPLNLLSCKDISLTNARNVRDDPLIPKGECCHLASIAHSPSNHHGPDDTHACPVMQKR